MSNCCPSCCSEPCFIACPLRLAHNLSDKAADCHSSDGKLLEFLLWWICFIACPLVWHKLLLTKQLIVTTQRSLDLLSSLAKLQVERSSEWQVMKLMSDIDRKRLIAIHLINGRSMFLDLMTQFTSRVAQHIAPRLVQEDSVRVAAHIVQELYK